MKPHASAPRPPSGPRPARTALAWRCVRCGTERHFRSPVPKRAAIPCPACGGTRFTEASAGAPVA